MSAAREGTASALDARTIALRSLLIDRTSRRVVESLGRAGVESLLLKGPTTARWLYPPGERSYLDLDILVQPEDESAVHAVLRDLGYANPRRSAAPDEQDDHAWTYRADRADQGELRVEVDVHYSLPGVEVRPDVVWRELRGRRASFPLAGRSVDALDEIGRTVVLVLHAARDARRKEQSFDDLRLLVTRLPSGDWDAVAELARRLGALDAFAAGLLLLDDGPLRLARLGIAAPRELRTLLNRRDVPATAQRVEQFSSTAGLRAKAGLAARELWPTDAWLAWWAAEEGVTAAGRAGLRLARIRHVLRGTPPAVGAWVRVRTAVRRQRRAQRVS